MELYNQDVATTFKTRAECQEWIRDRVVRFKLVVDNVVMPNGVVGLSQQKTDGRILNTKSEGYTRGGLDEPLKRYARPVRKGDVWVAAMLFER